MFKVDQYLSLAKVSSNHLAQTSLYTFHGSTRSAITLHFSIYLFYFLYECNVTIIDNTGSAIYTYYRYIH